MHGNRLSRSPSRATGLPQVLIKPNRGNHAPEVSRPLRNLFCLMVDLGKECKLTDNASAPNPWVVSDLYSRPDPANSDLSTPRLQVDGDLLICRGRYVRLPAICAWTNATEDLVPLKIDCRYPAWRPALFKPFCRVTISVSRSVQLRMRMIKSLIWSPLFIGLILHVSEMAAPEFLGTVLLIWGINAAVINRFLNRHRVLIIARWQKRQSRDQPHVFWLHGFRREFLDALAVHLDEVYSTVLNQPVPSLK